MIKDFIYIDGLLKKYKENSFYSVNNFSLSLPKGKIYGILGPNGAGKTTLIKIITGLLKADYGTVEIDGLTIPKNQKKANTIIGLIPQDIALYHDLTAYENLEYFASQYGIKKSEREIIINKYLNIIELYNRRNDLIKGFSGGMKRRINLIAGLLHSPKLLILDEPTVGTDLKSKNIILKLLRELNESGMTIIYTSHLMEEAEQICDDIIIMDKGSVVEKGTPKELINKYTDVNSLEEVFLKNTSN